MGVAGGGCPREHRPGVRGGIRAIEHGAARDHDVRAERQDLIQVGAGDPAIDAQQDASPAGFDERSGLFQPPSGGGLERLAAPAGIDGQDEHVGRRGRAAARSSPPGCSGSARCPGAG